MNQTACRRPGWKTTINCGTWLARAREDLSAVTENPLQEAQSLLGHVLDQPRAFLLAHPEHDLTPAHVQRLDELLARRAAGEPLPYLLGHWEFYGLDFTITPAVLIPRPETELLVEEAIRWLRAHPNRRTAADVGTGSGCIAISVTCSVPGTRFLAVDRSMEALRTACQNVERHAVERQVLLAQMDLLSATSGPLDLICANLPYIPTTTLERLDVSRWEPRTALDGGASGLDLIERLIQDADRLLTPGGVLLLEVEAGHGTTAPALARNLLPDAQVVLIRDLAGSPRLVRIQR